jgi:16S rRNA (guanine527-N7)-methyltransferase
VDDTGWLRFDRRSIELAPKAQDKGGNRCQTSGEGQGRISSMEILKDGALKLGINLSQRQIEQFRIYYRELINWNKRINLTRITDSEEVQRKHFLDSLTVAPAMKRPVKDSSLNVIDIGTGAGLPGIPLKIALPDISLTLLEATIKKTKFLKYIIKQLELNNVEIVSDRAEEAGHSPRYREKFDVVVSRAVASLPVLAELTLPFCTMGGRVIAQKKGDIKAEVKNSEKVIGLMGGVLVEVKPVVLEGLNDDRRLVIIDKIKPSPAEYPRRPGMPGKRPIVS